MNDEPRNEHVIKLVGKAHIEEPLLIGQNYLAKISGTVTAKTDSDNHDGSLTSYYKFEPVIVELMDDLGKSIRSKDTRSNSQLLRALLFKHWRDSASSVEFDTFYDGVMGQIMFEAQQIIDRYEKRTR